MFIAALILAQVVGAAPAPFKADAAPNSGIDTKQVKLKKGVSFDQDRIPVLPTPTPVPLPKAGAPAPAAAAQAQGKPAPDAETAWRQRATVARQAHESALSSYVAAKVAVGDCVTMGAATGLAGVAHSNCMASRTATLTPYEVNVTTTASAMAAVTEDCRRDVYCQPGWVADRVR